MCMFEQTANVVVRERIFIIVINSDEPVISFRLLFQAETSHSLRLSIVRLLNVKRK
jgi:hypothetical protein